jgi:beta-aspartyl-peptidase (threonine type)
MIVVASANGRSGIGDAMRILAAGGSALDAVEAGIRPVERDPADQTVGYGGLPNLLGEVELDASIMDGRTLRAGAVGALRATLHPISVARKVMEELPHVLLVGAGAERFAREMNFPEAELLTEESRRVWQELFATKAPSVYGERMQYLTDIRRFARLAADPERPNETVNFLARDRAGNLAVGVSTSGWAWKYPGRLGDSPIIGAGNYADNRAGAAACTGRGEMAMRCLTAHSLVMYLKQGLPLPEAGRRAVEDLGALEDPYYGRVSILALDRTGRHGGFCNEAGSTYLVQTPEMAEPQELPRLHVPVAPAGC